MQDAQLIQERQYSFPYHHVAQFRGRFRSAYYVRYGLKHACSLAWILEQIQKLEVSSILDVGCGDGRLVLELDQEFPDKEITGIDYSQRSIHLAMGLYPSGRYRKIDLLQDNFHGSFDLVTLIEVFEHIPVDQCEKFVAKLSGVVKSGGHLMVTVPHRNLPLSDKHYQHFSRASLVEYFQDTFKVKEVRYLERKSRLRLYLYYRLLKNKLFLLNNQLILNWIYKGYKKNLLLARAENDCERLYLLLTRK